MLQNRFEYKVKVVIFTVIISSIIKCALDLSGFRTWYLFAQIELSYLQTSLLYYGILFLGMAIYMAFYRARYTWPHIIMIALLPVAFFVSCCVKFLFGAYVGVFIAYIIILCIDSYGAVVNRPLHLQFNRKEYRINYINLMIKGFLNAFMVLMCACFFLIHLTSEEWLFISIDATAYKSMFQAEDSETVYATNIRDLQSTSGDDLWELNKNTLVELRYDKYQKKMLEERVFLFQEVLNIECEFLGVDPIPLVIENISDEHTLGKFCPQKQVIILERELIENDDNLKIALHTLLHEVHHFYAFNCAKELQKMQEAGVDMELLFARDIEKWDKEFRDYSIANSDSSEIEFYEYYSQAIETAGEEYAQKWTYYYFKYIESIEDEASLNI